MKNFCLLLLVARLVDVTSTSWEAAARAHALAHTDDLIEDLTTLVSFPSVSAVPEQTPDLRAAAEFSKTKLLQLGLENVQLFQPGSFLFGEHLHADKNAPTVLVYGHFDVQPAEPIDLWVSPPFNATRFEHATDGASIRGRGASDDKGGVLAALYGLLAVRATATGPSKFPVNLKVFLEGQEEIGSPDLPDFVRDHASLLSCDVVLSADGDMLSETQPSLTLGYRGAAAVHIQVTTAHSDLHSGSFGGSVPNAAHVLAEILASLHSNGAVAAPGFYDGVRALSQSDRSDLAGVPHNEAGELASLGIRAPHGERGFTALERRWARPTAEITGMWSGWTGDGTKTVLPATAHATIVARLVPDQVPVRAFEALRNHLLASAPARVANVSVTRGGFASSPSLAPKDTAANTAAAAVLEEIYGVAPVFKRSGGSIAAISLFHEHLRAHTTTLAFGYSGNSVHAPNEHMAIRDLKRGVEAWAAILFRLMSTHSHEAGEL